MRRKTGVVLPRELAFKLPRFRRLRLDEGNEHVYKSVVLGNAFQSDKDGYACRRGYAYV